MDNLPPIFLLPTHVKPDELIKLEEDITSLTYDIGEAIIVLGRIAKKERALFELRRLKLDTEPYTVLEEQRPLRTLQDEETPSPKRRRIDDQERPQKTALDVEKGTVSVVKLSWFTDSQANGAPLPLGEYLLYRGRKVKPDRNSEPKVIEPRITSGHPLTKPHGGATHVPAHQQPRSSRSHFSRPSQGLPQLSQPPPLLHETTSDHELPLPPIPDFLHTTYSCQRPTPFETKNPGFIDQLKKVRKLRLLQGDQIGVRAYSTCIATISAYPYTLQVPQEAARLPGCGNKIAALFQQWTETGQLQEVADADKDPYISVLQLFYNIWGVGDTTAREFHKKGWRDLDDLIEYAWPTLSRVQQIGIKYYDEFLLEIPREEVASIASTVLSQARRLHPGYDMVIAGGYRRGKAQSGDVDIVISHRDEERTLFLIEKLIMSLEKESYITHTLSLSNRNSERGQMPLPWKGEGRKGSGFDTLDKALVVWRDPSKGPEETSTAPHRRVDIIVTPWKTAGCAVLGWSGGTTFQRDVRRYCKGVKGLKFDSSGIRSRQDGRWIDLEGSEAHSDGSSGKGKAAEVCRSMEEAEKRVFERLGLEYREPWERCTG